MFIPISTDVHAVTLVTPCLLAPTHNALFYLFCSSIVINTVIVTAGNFEP